jgi:two-component system sensor histidine kinase UhpB
MALIIAVSVAAIIVFANLNLSEALFAWTRPVERFQLDELPFVLLVVAVSLIWFSMRRYAEAERELALRRVAEIRLASALEENRRLGQQYIHTQESERKALARDLHDEMGQYLNVIKLDAVSIRAATAAGDPSVHELTCSVIQNVDRVYRVVTGLIRQLRPVALDELGLAPALQQCVADWRRRLPTMTIELSICGDFGALDESRALTLFRLAQEALTNIARHSAATRVNIKMTRESAGCPAVDACGIVIEDNGIGTDLQRPQTGLGLIGMRERLAAIGGSLTLRSSPGNGFAMTACLPIAPAT